MASQLVRTRKQTRLVLLTSVAVLALLLAAGLAAAAPEAPGRMSLDQKATPTPDTPPTTAPQPTPGTVSGGVFGGLPIGNNGNGGGVNLGNGGQTGGQSSGTASQFAFTCGNATVDAAVLVTFRDVRPGFTYQVTVVGLDGFDPVIGLQAEDGSNLCNDDEPEVVGSQVDVPGVGLVTADNLSSQVRFTTSGSTGDIQMLIGGYGGQGGRYAAVFEGLAIAPSTETDEVTINVAPEIQNDELYVYMVSQTNDLDPIMGLVGSDMICDDAGTPPCGDTPAFSGGGVAIANGGTYIAGQFDAGLGVIPGGGGDLTFQFGSYEGSSAGNYAMIVIGSSPGASSGGQTSGGQTSGGLPDIATISYGQTVSGQIDDTNYAALYAFQGNAGDTVTARMEAAAGSDLDPYLGLMDADQNILIEDDDGGGDLNSQFTFTLPSAGTYVIIATRYDIDSGTTSGSFTLSLTSSGGGTSGGQTTTGNVQIMGAGVDEPWDAAPLITPGMAVGNTITDTDWGWAYALDVQVGQTITVRMEATAGGDLDCYLGLVDGNENVIAEDDDGGGGTDSEFVYTFSQAGRYYIVATRYNTSDGESSGPFVLTVTEGTAAGTTTVSNNGGDTTTGGALDYTLTPTFGSVDLVSGFSNDPYTEQIVAGGDVDAAAALGSPCIGFVASAPDYRLMYTSGQYNLRVFFAGEADTILVINTPDGGWYCDDDSGGDLHPLIDFPEPLSGQYDIWVGAYDNGQLVNGTLTITEMDILPSGSSKAAFSMSEDWK